MDLSYDMARQLLVFALSGGIVHMLCLLGLQSRPDYHGWRSITPGAMHWTGLGLSTALTALFAYVWLFVGSSRPDGAQQMTILFWLILVFGVGAIISGLTIRSIRKSDVRWRGRSIAFSSKAGLEKRKIEDVADLRSTPLGMSVRFTDGTSLVLDPYAAGAPALLDAITTHLEAQRPD